MLNFTLTATDCIETILPTVEQAMETGETCQLFNINFLGAGEIVALTLLALASNLMDSRTGQIYHARPGFHLLGIDASGTVSTLI